MPALSLEGLWEYRNARGSPLPGAVRLDSTLGDALCYVRSKATFAIGTSSTNAHNRWRAEGSMSVPTLGENTNNVVAVGIVDPTGGHLASMWINGNLALNVGIHIIGALVETVTVQQAGPTGTRGVQAGVHTWAVEGRGRWLYFFLDGVMIFSYPMPTAALEAKPLTQLIVSDVTYRSPSLYVDT